VMLDASGSTDPNMDPLTFVWEVLTGEPAVVLDDPTSVTPRFTAPALDAPTDLLFRVRASDGVGSSADEVVVRVLPMATPMRDAGPRRDSGPMGPLDGGMSDTDAGDTEPMDGCSCRATGVTSPRAPLALLLLALVALGRRR